MIAISPITSLTFNCSVGYLDLPSCSQEHALKLYLTPRLIWQTGGEQWSKLLTMVMSCPLLPIVLHTVFSHPTLGLSRLSQAWFHLLN